MKTYFFIGLFFIGHILASKAQVLDVAPNGRQNIRAIEGGGEQVSVDTKTPVIDLIQRLEKPWQFVETGKAYWIGYTNDMYSIASYKDTAILLLINFIDTAKNIQARLGGIYTIHLIGINSKIVGRFIEDFSDKKAREAILRYLDDKSLHETIVSLLMRDPWFSDIPAFMNYLSMPGRDYSKVLSALARYEFDNRPIGQKIDSAMISSEIPVLHPDTNPYSAANPIDALFSYEKAFGSRFIVDAEITQSSDWVKRKTTLSESKSYNTEQFGFSFSFLMGEIFNYCDFQDSYFYTFKNHTLTVYGPVKTRQIWLDWWSNLSDNEKSKFYSFVHLPIVERFKKK